MDRIGEIISEGVQRRKGGGIKKGKGKSGGERGDEWDKKSAMRKKRKKKMRKEEEEEKERRRERERVDRD